MESMDMDLILLGTNFSGEEPQSTSSALGDQMDCGTFDCLSDASLPNEFCKDSDLFLLDETPLNTLTNRENGITFMNPLSDLSLGLDPDFTYDEKHYFSSSLTDDYEKLFDGQGITNLLNCGNLMKSPLSSEDVESILDTASLSDGDTSFLPESPLSIINDNPPSISPPPNEELFVSLTSPSPKEVTISNSPSFSEVTPDCSLHYEEIPASASPSLYEEIPASASPSLYEEIPASASPSLYEEIPASTSPSLYKEIPASTSPSLYEKNPSFPAIFSIFTDESDGTQAPDIVLEVPFDCSVSATTRETTMMAPSRGVIDDHPCLLVSSPRKEKRPKSYRTKKTPYNTWDKGTESISSPTIDILDIPEHLSKKEKKKLQNKNAATRYRQKMKEEADMRKQEEDDLLKENKKLRNRVEDIQKEIQYLKNLLKEIGKVGTKP